MTYLDLFAGVVLTLLIYGAAVETFRDWRSF